MADDTIKVGDYIVVQRQGYTKLHKIKQHGNLNLGNFTVEMDCVVGEKYFATFQMKNSPGNKRMYVLEKVDGGGTAGNISVEKSGADNRHIMNDGQSQTLTKDEIDKLKDEEFGSNAIVGHLVSNSKTFEMKTEYSQEKYIKKKEKKYFEYIQIRKPTVRLLVEMFYRQDPAKILGIRMDDLSQILIYANLHAEGNHLLYDSGTSGLLPASILHAIGPNTTGKLVHMHPGNEFQKNALMAMQFPQEQYSRCVNVNIYSVLRHYYQVAEPAEDEEPSTKKPKLDEDMELKKPGWHYDNEKACVVLREKVDSLIVVAKEHPVSLIKELVPFLKGGRNLVVFNLLREPLQDLYIWLKSRHDIVGIKLSNNFMRKYQILPNRTHPHVNMTSGGYVLTATMLN